jgi:cytoskeletal protein RodZ
VGVRADVFFSDMTFKWLEARLGQYRQQRSNPPINDYRRKSATKSESGSSRRSSADSSGALSSSSRSDSSSSTLHHRKLETPSLKSKESKTERRSNELSVNRPSVSSMPARSSSAPSGIIVASPGSVQPSSLSRNEYLGRFLFYQV